MAKERKHLKLAQDRVSRVPAEELAKFAAAMEEKVIKPVREREVAQREKLSKARARPVR